MHRTDIWHATDQLRSPHAPGQRLVTFDIDPGYYREVVGDGLRAGTTARLLPAVAIVVLNIETRRVNVVVWDESHSGEAHTRFDNWDDALDYRPGVLAVYADAVAAAVDLFDLGPRRN